MKPMHAPAALLSAALVAPALAQQTLHTEAATMPSPGTFVLLEQFHWTEYGLNPDTGSERTTNVEWLHILQIGLARDFALDVEVPIEWRVEEEPDGSDEHDQGVGEIDLTFKYRFFRKDLDELGTVRAALLFGTSLPSGDDHDFSSNAVSPLFGAVVTAIKGRFGINQDLLFRWNTNGDDEFNLPGKGPSEAIMHDTSFVFRLAPEEYTEASTGAWYATFEVNGVYETNGDYEVVGGPGLMYEARRFAVEALIEFPMYDGVDERAEIDLRVEVGIRFSF